MSSDIDLKRTVSRPNDVVSQFLKSFQPDEHDVTFCHRCSDSNRYVYPEYSFQEFRRGRQLIKEVVTYPCNAAFEMSSLIH